VRPEKKKADIGIQKCIACHIKCVRGELKCMRKTYSPSVTVAIYCRLGGEIALLVSRSPILPTGAIKPG